VGTGGAHLYSPRAIRPNSEVIGSTFGVPEADAEGKELRLAVRADSGKSFTISAPPSAMARRRLHADARSY
jgi:hypothetical protein